ncbi:hypothetical protein LTS18_006225 [Coniosporium uncinatum]|uniref:Uncharacterized protein n=1 Tax=Coniosporium uncinatum TaxID=93489 RepID=A0ACC3DD79_9PEZI|nr:hypothetical protein LTS18_006225 [Coniosporium uncinatum]
MPDESTSLAQPSVAAAVFNSKVESRVALQGLSQSVSLGQNLNAPSDAAYNPPPTKRKGRPRRKKPKSNDNNSNNNSPARETRSSTLPQVGEIPPSTQPSLPPTQQPTPPTFPKNRDSQWTRRKMIPNSNEPRSIPPHLRRRALQPVLVQPQAAGPEDARSGKPWTSHQTNPARATNPDLSVKPIKQVNSIVPTPNRHAEPVGMTPPLTDGPSSKTVDFAERQEQSFVKSTAKRDNTRSKLEKIAPPKVLSNAWGSDTEHGAPSFHEWDDPADAVRALVDWNGDWLPPPVEWEGRRSYRDRDFHATIEGWITNGECECRERKKSGKCSCRTIEISRYCDIPNGEIALREWVPTDITGEAPQLWWKRQMGLFGEDEEFVRMPLPWWNMYQSNQGQVIVPLKVPTTRLDPNDSGYARAVAESTSNQRIEAKAARYTRAEEEKKRHKRRTREQKRNESKPLELPNPNRPSANLYIRHVTPLDISQMTDILNYYIKNTVFTPEMRAVTDHTITNRMVAVETVQLPWIVAVEKTTSKDRKTKAYSDSEKVIGFAFADDYHSPTDMYRYCAEMEIYVHSEYYMKGVGRCLMDQMLFCLDPQYNKKGGYEWRAGEASHFQYPGGARVLGSVICHIPYDPAASTRRKEWLDLWLGKRFYMTTYEGEPKRWKKVGEMEGVGIKNGVS